MYSKRICYSNIEKYDSQVPINPIQDPFITSGIPSIFLQVGKIPPTINNISESETKKCSSRYQKAKGSV